jgi:ribosomal protein L11 methyltransferase
VNDDQGKGWTAWRDVPAADRAATEASLEHLAEEGCVVTSRELSRDGPWRVELFGEGTRPKLGSEWTWEALPEKDWVAENQRSFQPFRVGPFWVHPSHTADDVPPGTIPLRIDAGMAFGTGTHATTRGCLEMLATLDPCRTRNAVDVGCGSGILAIAMAKLWDHEVLGGDNDPQAVAVAVENAALNGVAPLCRFVVSVGLSHAVLAQAEPYDLVVANILAGPLVELTDTFKYALRPGGLALLSGLLVEQADMVISAYARCDFALERQIDLETGGAWWRTLLLRRS